MGKRSRETEKTEKEDFESPLSRFIRMYCSQCHNYPALCNLVTEFGLRRMKICLDALWTVRE